VLVTDILADQGEALADEIGPAAKFQRQDVSKHTDWAAAVAAAEAAFGPVSILVNNAVRMDLAAFEAIAPSPAFSVETLAPSVSIKMMKTSLRLPRPRKNFSNAQKGYVTFTNQLSTSQTYLRFASAQASALPKVTVTSEE